jgi:hypothetical protein
VSCFRLFPGRKRKQGMKGTPRRGALPSFAARATHHDAGGGD